MHKTSCSFSIIDSLELYFVSVLKIIGTCVLFAIYSGGACSLSAGLGAIGLDDVRVMVRLMCLCAAGRVSADHTTADDGQSKKSHSLGYLSNAIGALAQDKPDSSNLLVQLCNKVKYFG